MGYTGRCCGGRGGGTPGFGPKSRDWVGMGWLQTIPAIMRMNGVIEMELIIGGRRGIEVGGELRGGDVESASGDPSLTQFDCQNTAKNMGLFGDSSVALSTNGSGAISYKTL